MVKIDPYKVAPTWLYRNGESKLFKTQFDVDKARLDGWGPPGTNTLVVEGRDGEETAVLGIISNVLFPTKGDMAKAVEEDPRYESMPPLNLKRTMEELKIRIRRFEIETGILNEDGTLPEGFQDNTQ